MYIWFMYTYFTIFYKEMYNNKEFDRYSQEKSINIFSIYTKYDWII